MTTIYNNMLSTRWDYTPENSNKVYHYKDFIELTKGNLQYALLLRERLTWQHPETLVDEDLREGEIVEFNHQYILTGGQEIEILTD